MKEYSFKSVVEVLKNFTVPQLSQHLKWVLKRERRELQRLLSVYHTKEPKKLFKELEDKEHILRKLEKYQQEKLKRGDIR